MYHTFQHVVNQRSKWILHLAKLKYHSQSNKAIMIKTIDGIKQKGYCIFSPDDKILFFKPVNCEHLYVDKSKKEFFRCYFFDREICNHILIFINNLWTKQELLSVPIAADYYSADRLNSNNQQDFYQFDKQHIQSCWREIKKLKNQGMYQYANIVAKEVYTKSNDFVNYQERIDLKVKSLLIQSECYLQMRKYCKSLKYILKSIKKYNNLCYSVKNRMLFDHLKLINSQLMLNYHLNYHLATGKFQYQHHKFSFSCSEIKLVRPNRYQTVKQKIKILRKKRCQTCHIVSLSIQNKKCSKCRVTYYCSKKCQKIDWNSHHKQICIDR